MPYYVHTFCRSDEIPSIDALETALRDDYPSTRIVTEQSRDSPTWRNAEVLYKEDRQPIVIEINVNDGPNSLAAEECEEFIQAIGRPGFSRAKSRVLNHLRHTRYIVSCQLFGDIDDDGYHLNGELLNHFAVHHGGLVQADGEGFYSGHKIVVRVE